MSSLAQKEANHQATWDRACFLGEFSIGQLAVDVGASHAATKRHVDEWVGIGAVENLGQQGRRRIHFRVVTAADDKTVSANYLPKGTPAENMWRTMRLTKVFALVDVVLMSCTSSVQVDEKTAQKFCQMLLRGGYLKVEQEAVSGRRAATYRLIRNTGPRPPQERRVRVIWDENLADFTHMAGRTQ